jgi:hypothetical protein
VPEVDEKIMAELLKQKGVREHVKNMTPDELAFYRELLVSQGIYARYLKERKGN